MHADLDTSVVDEAIDLSPEIGRACGVGKDLLGVGDIGDEAFHDAGTRRGRGQALQFCLGCRHRKDVGILRDQALGDGRAEVARGAGDDDIFAFE